MRRWVAFVGLNRNVRRLSDGAVGRKLPDGNALLSLRYTRFHEASAAQSALVASQAHTVNERSAENRFWVLGSASPATGGRSSALTLTTLTFCGRSPARSTVSARPATPSSEAQLVPSVSSIS